jgi:hypothetical protein
MSEADSPDVGIICQMTPEQALAATLAFLDSSPDDQALCSAAVTIGEPLIDCHWQAIGEHFLALLAERSDLRKMLSCCDFDEAVPELLRERLYRFVRQEDDLGHQRAAAEPGSG